MPYTIFVNNSANSNTTVNSTGNDVLIRLNPPIQLDNKKDYVLRVLSAQILYCFSNIFTGVNDKIYYSMGTNNYTITFPQGIYSLSSMNDEISRQTNDENDNGYLITLQGDSANSSVYLTFNDPTLTINCNHSDSALQLLGFPMSTGILGPYAETGTQYSTGLPAILNTTSSIIMTCDACGGLCYKNGSSSSVVASILINTVPFQVIDYEPINPPRIHLSKYSLDSIEFTLYNQNLTPIDMNSNNGTQPYEAWTAVIEIDEYTKEGRLI